MYCGVDNFHTQLNCDITTKIRFWVLWQQGVTKPSRDLKSESQRQAHENLSRFTVGFYDQLALAALNIQEVMLDPHLDVEGKNLITVF